MSIYTGSIEMGSVQSDCRVPDAVWHFNQFKGQARVPNYGINKAFPELRKYDDYDAGWITGLDSFMGGPPIKMRDFYGGSDCRPTQVIVSMQGCMSEFNYLVIRALNVNGQCYWQFGGDQESCSKPFYYSRMDNYYYDGTNFLYDVTTYHEWDYGSPPYMDFPSNITNFNYGPDGRTTFLISVDPSYGLDNAGPFNGAYVYPTPGATQMGGYPVYLNGYPARNTRDPIGGFPFGPNAYYGVFDRPFQPAPATDLTCDVFPDFILDDDCYLDTGNYEEETFYGLAIFRDRPPMTYDEYMCWHMEYDWSIDPGFK